jgi:hypothetical protein
MGRAAGAVSHLGGLKRAGQGPQLKIEVLSSVSCAKSLIRLVGIEDWAPAGFGYLPKGRDNPSVGTLPQASNAGGVMLGSHVACSYSRPQ